ncbi:MAG: endonuclease III [Chloroflexota bacterium]|nr:endonuclease III [Chloroflexota bacterium]
MSISDQLPAVTHEMIVRAVPLLVPLYGERQLTPCPDNLAELIYTILSHRTTKADEQEAFRRMWAAFNTWEAIENAPLPDLIETLSLSRFPERKAPYIQNTLRAIRERTGGYSIDFLHSLSTEDALTWLLTLPGVGFKTATLVLLFCFHRPVLPVDTHVHRVSIRLGIIPAKMSQETAHVRLLAMFPPDAHLLYNFHKLFLKHGQQLCTFSSPRCSRCPLVAFCPYGQARMAGKTLTAPPPPG